MAIGRDEEETKEWSRFWGSGKVDDYLSYKASCAADSNAGGRTSCEADRHAGSKISCKADSNASLDEGKG